MSEVTIGSNLDIDVEYELTTQENRTEVEGALSGAIKFVCKLSASGNGQYETQTNLRSENLRISIKGSLKKTVSITNAGK